MNFSNNPENPDYRFFGNSLQTDPKNQVTTQKKFMGVFSLCDWPPPELIIDLVLIEHTKPRVLQCTRIYVAWSTAPEIKNRHTELSTFSRRGGLRCRIWKKNTGVAPSRCVGPVTTFLIGADRHHELKKKVAFWWFLPEIGPTNSPTATQLAS